MIIYPVFQIHGDLKCVIKKNAQCLKRFWLKNDAVRSLSLEVATKKDHMLFQFYLPVYWKSLPI